MRVIPLEIGRLDTDMRIITGEDGTRTFPIPAWLIEHPDGLALFDTGMHPDLQIGTDRIGERTAEFFDPDFQPGEELTARLDAVGVRPSDVDLIVFSHLHFDHAGGTAEIPDARIVIQRDEWEAGHAAKYLDAGVYNSDDYDHGHDVELVDGAHDVFGDGTVTCVPTPGHTPGHQSLRVELESGPVVFTGDCIYLEELLDDMAVPTFGSDRSKARQLESMVELRRLRDVDGCSLVFGHDLDQFRTIPTSGLT